MGEVLLNNAATSLVNSITNVATAIVVQSAASFPTSGSFRVLVDSEIMLVTGVSGTTFTVQRGMEGSTSNAHAANASVTAVLTAGGLQSFCQGSLVAVNYSPTPTFDLDAGYTFEMVLGGNPVLSLANAAPGRRFLARLIQDLTGGRTVTWWSGIVWAGGPPPTLNTNPNGADLIGFLCLDGGIFYGMYCGQFSS
jgi:hypothetical protein